VDSRLDLRHGRDPRGWWGAWGLAVLLREHVQRMTLRRPLAALLLAAALAGPLSACSSAGTGGNTDVERNEQDCGTAEQAPGQNCQQSEDGPAQGS
jgi:hypothetical protein